MLTHSLYSQDLSRPVAFFEKFNKEDIKKEIINHLTKYPEDTLEHCKEYSKSDIKKYYGSEIINFYSVNPKSGKVCKVVLKGNKEFYQPLN